MTDPNNTDILLINTQDRVRTLTLNRPQALNALNSQVLDELIDAFAAYQAEILRGGFQGVGSGQEEAAKALGVPYRHRIARILLPQAFRLALPATINQFVITFMETSLVVVVGFVELLAAGNAAYGTGDWKFAYVEVYVFISAIYFSFVFGLSRYGAYLERRMNIGRR